MFNPGGRRYLGPPPRWDQVTTQSAFNLPPPRWSGSEWFRRFGPGVQGSLQRRASDVPFARPGPLPPIPQPPPRWLGPPATMSGPVPGWELRNPPPRPNPGWSSY